MEAKPCLCREGGLHAETQGSVGGGKVSSAWILEAMLVTGLLPSACIFWVRIQKES